VFAQHRRYLPVNDQRRLIPFRGVTEDRKQPATMRTREISITRGKQLDDLNDAVRCKVRGAKSAHAKLVLKWGITGSCAFLRLPSYDPFDRAFIDYMHLLKNVVWQHLVKRMLGLCSPPPLPKNEMKKWDDAKRLSVTPRD